MQIKKIVISTIVISSLFLSASPALAHVTVKPNEVGAAAFQTFTVGVPVEKDIPTTEIRLVIPDGLHYATPNVKPGWTIDVKKKGEGEDAKVTEITWTGGTIPAGQRDEFVFSAQVPASPTNVVWKAYQTYEDGTVVSWDQDPKAQSGHDEEDSDKGPYSQTKVVDDLTQEPKDQKHDLRQKDFPTKISFVLSVAAIALSSVALYQTRKRKKN